MWNPFRSAKTVTVLSQPINKDVARTISGFSFRRVWTCASCSAQIAIRARDPREDGPSNFTPQKSHGELNWNGLAVEAGWVLDPYVMCPACRRGMTIAEYKEHRKNGGL